MNRRHTPVRLATVDASARRLHSSLGAQNSQRTRERRLNFGGVAAIIAAGGLVVAATLSAGETTRSKQDIINCAVANIGEAATRGVEVSLLSDGAVAQFAADCDPSSVDPLTPVHAQDYYLQLVDDIRP